MTTFSVTASSRFALRCNHRTIIFRNDALEQKYPDGLTGFRNRYQSGSNGLITVYCEVNTAVDTIRELEAIGLEQGDDYVVIDTDECEMMQMVGSDQVERPYWFEAGADWLRYKNCNGKVLVWYDR